MKLRLGKVLIETDHIEMIERLSPHNVKLFFVSGNVLEVVRGIKSTAAATWELMENLCKLHKTQMGHRLSLLALKLRNSVIAAWVVCLSHRLSLLALKL